MRSAHSLFFNLLAEIIPHYTKKCNTPKKSGNTASVAVFLIGDLGGTRVSRPSLFFLDMPRV